MSCIYERSSYYAKAVLDPCKIIEPIGYSFLNESDSKKQVFKKKEGELKYKFVVEKTLMKQISSRGTRDIAKFLKVEDAPRKNFYISGLNLEFVNKNLTPQIMRQIKAHFFSKETDNELLTFLQLLGSLNTISDNLFSIRDYVLSTYFVYYHGENTQFYKYFEKTLKEQFLQYETEILINSPKLSRPQLRKIEYHVKEEVEKYISEIEQIGKEKDALYNGIHLYICDFLPQTNENQTIIMEESSIWEFIQFNIIVMMNILGDGQHATLKFRGTYTHKTSEYIFMLKLAFNKVYMSKNIISNPFTNDRYIICESFNKENGRQIARFLLENYYLISKHGADKLLIDHKQIFAQDFQTNITNFNDLSPIIKVTKDVLNEFMENNNIEFYPNKEALIKKLGEIRWHSMAELTAEIQELIPNNEAKDKVKKEEVFQKEAVEIDFNLMDAAMNNTKKDKKNEYYDISKRKEDKNQAYLDRYLEKGEKMLKDKKEKSKKKKAERRQE